MPDYTVEDTVYKRFTTRAFATGIPTTLAGTPVVSAYEDDSITQITAGITLGVDHDGVGGLNLLTIVATGANGYEAGKSYDLVITTGTVGGVSVVGEVVWHFTLSAEAAAVDLANGTDGLGAIKAETAAILVDTAEIGAAGAGLTAINLPNQTMDITGNLSGSVGSVTGAVGSVTGSVGSVVGHTAQTGDSFARLAAPAGASVSADIAAVKAETALILTDTGTTLDTKINDIQGATFSSATDSLEAIRDRGDAAWTTGAGGTGLTALDSGTLRAGGTSTQALLPTAKTFADDILNGTVINLLTGTGAAQSRVITDYTSSTDTATVSPAWTTSPDATTTYEVVQGSTNLAAISLTAQTAGDVTADTAAILVDTADMQPKLGTPAAADISADIAVVAGNVLTTRNALVLSSGTADAGGSTTTMVDAGRAEADDDYWKGASILFTNGAAASQVREITGFVAATDTMTFAPATTAAHGTGAAYIIISATASTGLTAGQDASLTAIEVDTNALNDTKIPDTISLAAINAEVDTAIADVNLDHLVGTATGIPAIVAGTYLDQIVDDGTASFDRTTDSLQAIRDRGDAAWTTGAGGSDRLLLADTTIATLASQTSFTLTAGSADDDAYNNCTIVVEDVATATQKAVGVVLDYTGSTKTVTLKEALAFTIAATDKVYILAENALKSTVANRQLDVTATGAAGIDWGNVENPTTALDLSATDIQLADTVTTLTGHTAQTGDSFARLGAPAAASVSADIAVIDGNVDQIETAVITNAAGADIAADIIAVKAETALILTDTGTTLDTKINDIQGATFSSATDSLEAIRDRGDAAWITGAGGSDRLLLVDTTIATLATQTSFTLTAGSTDNDAYNNCTIVVEDVATSTQKAVGVILDYVGSTKTVTLKEALAFTIATTDKVYVLAENALKSTVANRQLDVTATGGAGIDWGNVENPTTALDLSATDIQLADTVTTLTGHTAQTGDSFARLGAPAGASVSADVAAVKVDTAAILVDTGTTLDAAIAVIDANVDQIETAVITNAAGADIAADIIAVKAETALIVADTNELQTDWTDAGRLDAILDTINARPTAAMTESYAANGAAPTPDQALMAIHQMLMDFSIAGTTLTVEQLDGTTAFLVTLDDGTSPTSANRA